MRSARSAAKKGQEIMDELLSEIIGDLGIICMPGCESFVDRVQYYLKQWNGSEVDDYIVNGVISRFSTGEAKGFLRETVRGKDLYFITDCFNYSVTYNMYGREVPMSPDDHFQDLKRMISAAGGKAKRITVIMPMLYEGRQHKRSGRESLDCALALQELVNMGVENIITFDAHDPRVQNAIPLSGFDNVQPSYQMMKALIREVPDIDISDPSLAIISPDEGGVSRCLYYSSVLNINMGMFYKRRNYSVVINGRNPIEAHEYLGHSVEGKDIIVVDDMISTGESMLDIFKSLKERGARRIFAFVSFALFTNGMDSFDKARKEGLFDKVFATNLIYTPSELLSREWFVSVDLSKYVAYLIEALNHDESITHLIDPFKKIKTLLAEHNQKRAQDLGEQTALSL
ncbi:MAG: ribose-phosphate pyrophosphokinase [Oscillospiraceae bacterium]|nr:ribose-phosphate pyrophosphokinase [Oscillospiraceae bacterium]